MYESQAPGVRALIADDAQAQDVVALAGRRAALERFRKMLDDDAFFDSQIEENKGMESVWQKFFETNPWVLGVGLGTQLFTSWSEEKLEQIVSGHSIAGDGKRADAVLRTSGLIQSMVFAEIKHHRTRLLKDEYRPSVWSMPKELAGGISQAQVIPRTPVENAGGDLEKVPLEVARDDLCAWRSGSRTENPLTARVLVCLAQLLMDCRRSFHPAV